jgi:glycosyltransferase involved in cell wall biosynthesis
MTQPLISAIICTHNRACYLGAAIASLLEQTYTAYEIIVVDNASTDDTRAVVETYLPYPTLTYMYESTLGLSAARNRGGGDSPGHHSRLPRRRCRSLALLAGSPGSCL